MTINSVQLNQSAPFAGLGTATFNVPADGLYSVAVKSFIPYVAPGSADTSTSSATDPAASGLDIKVKLNGTDKLHLSAPGPTEPLMGGSVALQCSAADVITVVFSSSAAADAKPNAVKSIINIYQGE